MQRYPVGQKFRGNSSIWHSFQDISIFCVLQFLRKIRKFKMAASLYRDTLWVKNFVEIALSRTVFEIYALLCFPYLENL